MNQLYGINFSDNLEHHQIFGGKWGKRNGPPYPLKPEAYSAEEKRRMTPEERKEKLKEKKEIRVEKKKEEVIREGDIKTALKDRNNYTDQELKAVMDRYDLNQKLSSLNEKKVKSGRQKLDDATAILNSVVKFSSAGISLYNNTAKVANALNGGGMPLIGQDNNNKKDKKNKKD